MAFADIRTKTTVNSTVSSLSWSIIVDIMENAYNNSDDFRSLYDAFISVSGRTVVVNYVQGVAQGQYLHNTSTNTYTPLGIVNIDPTYITDGIFISTTGKAVQDTLTTGFIHELGHALGAYGDDHNRTPIPNFTSEDYMGDNVRHMNEVNKDLGLAQQASYIGIASNTELVVGFEYSQGNAIVGAVVTDGDFRSMGSSDVLIGTGAANIFSSGDGNDYLYGEGGSDTFNPGGGNDFINGSGPISYASDTTDTLDYSVGNTSVTIAGGNETINTSSTPAGINVSLDYTTSTLVNSRKVFTVSDDGYGGADKFVSIEKLVGTVHDDTFVIKGEINSADRMEIVGNGADDHEMIDLSSSTKGYHIELNAAGAGQLYAVNSSQAKQGSNITLTGMSADIKGSDHNDTITTAVAGSTIQAGDGDDLISATDPTATVDGGAGKDRIIVTGNQTVDGGTGNDMFDLRNASDATIKIGTNSGHDTIANWGGQLTIDFGSISASTISFGWDPVANSSEPDVIADGLWRLMKYSGLLDIRTSTGGIISLENLSLDGFSIAKGFDWSGDPTGDPYGPLGVYGEPLNISSGLSFKFADGTYDLMGLLVASGAFSFDNTYDYIDFPFGGDPIDYSQFMVANEGYQSGVTNVSDASDLIDWATNFYSSTPITTGILNSTPMASTSGDDVFVAKSSLNSVTYASATSGVTIDLQVAGRQNTGGAGNDVLINVYNVAGSSYADDLTAAARGSTLSAGAGNDILHGDYSTLNGDDGADIIYAGAKGYNTVNGGAGNDAIYLDTAHAYRGLDTVDGGADSDTAYLSGVKSDYSFQRAADGAVIVTYKSGMSDFTVARISNVETFTFSDASSFTATQLAGGYGTSGDDTWVAGTSGDDYLYGLAGDDTLYGGSGNDKFLGGEGYDQVNLDGNLADYRFTWMPWGTIEGRNILDNSTFSFDSIEAVYFEGNSIWRSIEAVAGDFGTSDNDAWIAGTIYADSLYGLEGDDSLFGDAGDDYINGGDGEDQANYDGSLADFTFQRQADGSVIVTDTVGNEGTDRLAEVEAVYFDGNGAWRTLAAVAGDYGTMDSDAWLQGTAKNDHLYGLAGDDVLIGREGDDVIDGGTSYYAGDQAVYQGDLSDFTIVRNADGSVTVTDLVGDEGTDTLIDIESVYFNGSEDWVDLTVLSYERNGTSGDDILIGNQYIDLINGLGGDDTLAGGGGNDIIDGGDGDDTAVFDGPYQNYAFTQRPDGSVWVIDLGFQGVSDKLVDVENLYFPGDDTNVTVASALASGGVRAEQTGTEDQDFLNGTQFNDDFIGGDGDDYMTSNGGADRFYGGDGDDIAFIDWSFYDYGFYENLDGSVTLTKFDTKLQILLDDVEEIFFGSGDVLTTADALTLFDEGYLTVSGTSGNDNLYGSNYEDLINAGAGNDFIRPGGGDDTVQGGDGNDTVDYYYSIDNYSIVLNGDGTLTIADIAHDRGDGTDTLDGVEFLRFGLHTYTVQEALDEQSASALMARSGGDVSQSIFAANDDVPDHDHHVFARMPVEHEYVSDFAYG